MKSRSSVLTTCVTAVLGISMILGACSSNSSSDTTIAAAVAPVDTMSEADDAMSDESMTDTDDAMGASPYCANAEPLKALNLKAATSDVAGGAAMALDSVMGEFSEALQKSSASMQEFLMEAATSASAKDGSSHQATLDEVLKWFDERC